MRGMGSVYRRGRIWWLKFYIQGEVRYESSESSVKGVAIDLLKKKFTTPGPRASGRVLVSDLINDLEDYYRAHNPKSYSTMYIPCIKHVSKYFGTWKASKVSTASINQYKTLRTDQEASNGSINRELALLRRAYKLAFEASPKKVAEVPKFKLLPEANPRQGFLDPEQYRKLRDALPEDLRPVFIVGYHTGARKAEVLGIRKDQVDWEAKKIRLNVGETKNGGGRYLPIYGDMIEAIEPLLSSSGPYLFQRFTGDRIINLRPAWENAITACGVAGKPNPLVGLLFHDLRRSAVRNMIRAGIPQEVAKKISGHKTDATFKRYNVVDERDIDNAGERMTAFLAPGVTSKPTNGDNPGDRKQDEKVRIDVNDWF